MKIEDIMFRRDILKILRTRIDLRELDNMNFALVIPSFGISERTDTAFVHTISELYIRKYSKEYTTEVKEAYQKHKKEKRKGNPLGDFLETLDKISPTLYNPRENILRVRLPYLLGDAEHTTLRQDSRTLLEGIVTGTLQYPQLRKDVDEINIEKLQTATEIATLINQTNTGVVKNLQNNFWERRLFRDGKYQGQLIRLYCDIISHQDLR